MSNSINKKYIFGKTENYSYKTIGKTEFIVYNYIGKTEGEIFACLKER